MPFDVHKMIDIGVNKRVELLSEIIGDDVEYRTPASWTPTTGKQAVIDALTIALPMLQDMQYQRIWSDPPHYALEFTALVRGRQLHAIDLVTADDSGRIARLEAIVRPLSAILAIREAHLALANEEVT